MPTVGQVRKLATLAIAMLSFGPVPSEAAPSRLCGPISVSATAGTGDDDGMAGAIGVSFHYTSLDGLSGVSEQMLLSHGAAPTITAHLSNLSGMPFALTLTNPHGSALSGSTAVISFNGVPISALDSTLGPDVTFEINADAQATVSCVTSPDPAQRQGCLDSAFTIIATGCQRCGDRRVCARKCRVQDHRFEAYSTDQCAAGGSRLGRNSTTKCTWQGFYTTSSGQCSSCQRVGNTTCLNACNREHPEYAAYPTANCTDPIILPSTMACYRSMYFKVGRVCTSCSRGGDCIAECDRTGPRFNAYDDANCSDASAVILPEWPAPTAMPTARPTTVPSVAVPTPEPTPEPISRQIAPTLGPKPDASTQEEQVTVQTVIIVSVAAIFVVIILGYVYYKWAVEGTVQDARFRRRTMTSPIWDAGVVINDYTENVPVGLAPQLMLAASPIRNQGTIQSNPLWKDTGPGIRGSVISSGSGSSPSNPYGYRPGPAAGGRAYNDAADNGFGGFGDGVYAEVSDPVYAVVSDADLHGNGRRKSYTTQSQGEARSRSGRTENAYEYDTVVVNTFSGPGPGAELRTFDPAAYEYSTAAGITGSGTGFDDNEDSEDEMLYA